MVKKTLFKEFGKNVWGEYLYIVEYKGAKNVLPTSEIADWCKSIDENDKRN